MHAYEYRYEPAWDLSERVSCSNWAESSYSRLFRGVQNSLVNPKPYTLNPKP